MPSQCVLPNKAFAASSAAVWFDAGVDAHVAIQVVFAEELLRAGRAGKGTRDLVDTVVGAEVAEASKVFGACWACDFSRPVVFGSGDLHDCFVFGSFVVDGGR